MSITEQGRDGEKQARLFLKRMGCSNIFPADCLIKLNSGWYVVEVKKKEKFKPPPFWGHGLDVRQIKARLGFYKETGIRCLFLVFDVEGEIYWQWLDVLESGQKFTTRNTIRIYPLENFHRIDLFW